MLTSNSEIKSNKLDSIPVLQNLKCKELSNQSGAYVFDIAANSEFQLAASLSDNTIKLLDSENLDIKYSWKAHKKKITNLKFSPVNQQHLLSSSLEGCVCLWDLRCSIDKPAIEFRVIDASSPVKPITCFDIDISGSYICAGTQLVHEDSFILFWDTRKITLLGGYWNSHFDEITQVKFHSPQQKWMISGSEDGLINLFDISKSCEDEALVTTFNSECGIYKLEWFPESKNFACITDNQDLQIWNINDSAPHQTFTREKLTDLNKGAKVDYLIDVMKHDSSLQLMSGNYSGINSLWELHESECQLLAIVQGKEDVVIRTCVWNSMKNFVTGGEDGDISIWKAKDVVMSTTKQKDEMLNINEKKNEILSSECLKQEIEVPNVENVKETNSEILPPDTLKIKEEELNIDEKKDLIVDSLQQEIEVPNVENFKETNNEILPCDSLKQEIEVLSVENVEEMNNEILPSDSLKIPSSLKKQARDVRPYEIRSLKQ